MLKNYKLLESLTSTHSVTGDTSEIIKFLMDFFEENSIEYFQDGFGTLYVGNKNAKKLFAAHIDEVGFQVTNTEESGKVRILPIGCVDPESLNQELVYLNTKQGKSKTLILHDSDLKSDNKISFEDLYIKAEDTELGMTGTYDKVFIESSDSIIATSIDNKISVFVLLEQILSNKKLLEHNMFAFTTDEEMQDHSANGVCFNFKPDFAFVLDYIPNHQKIGQAENLGEKESGSLVMYRGGQYIIHPKMREFFETKIKTKFQKGFLSENTLPSIEPNNFENNGHTVAANVCITSLGYHGSAYMVSKKDIEDFETLVREIAEIKI